MKTSFAILLVLGIQLLIIGSCKDSSRLSKAELDAISIQHAKEDFSDGFRRYYIHGKFYVSTQVEYMMYKEYGINLKPVSPDFIYDYIYIERINELTLNQFGIDSLQFDSLLKDYQNEIDSFNINYDLSRFHDGVFSYSGPFDNMLEPTLQDGYSFQDMYLDSCLNVEASIAVNYWYVINEKGEVTQIEIEAGPTVTQVNKLKRCLSKLKFNPAVYNGSIVCYRESSVINIDCLKECNE